MGISFFVIEINDGGAECTDYDREGVLRYLGDRRPYWRRTTQEFESRTWQPGDWMEYPCGWIFCVRA